MKSNKGSLYSLFGSKFPISGDKYGSLSPGTGNGRESFTWEINFLLSGAQEGVSVLLAWLCFNFLFLYLFLRERERGRECKG